MKTRRDVFKMLGGISALALLAKCGGEAAGSEAAAGSAGTGAGTAGTGGSGTAGTGGSSTGGAGGDTSGVAWATAGTSVLVGKDYGNPFASGIGTTCSVYKSSTGGPCHATSDTLVRKDVSEGHAGLPTRLELLLVDKDCNPLPGATVEIWHCDTKGTYTGDIDGNNDAFCTGGDAEAAASLAYRGIQTADATGRVTFDTNFPGWYGGRATHIHFKITMGTTEYLTSQLFFDEALKIGIYATEPNYEPSTAQGYQPNATDQVISQAGLTIAEVTMSTAKQSDGAMLAWKAITVES
jgi:protocatechuate 3,4-dioxygenase beta subunit